MRRKRKSIASKSVVAALLIAFFITTAACRNTPGRMQTSSMGSAEDIAYAKRLWSVLEEQRLAGPQGKKTTPFVGAARPHGWILELLYQNITVGTHTGFIVIKRNYDGPDVSVANVEADRERYLSSVTIMFQREAGYDEDNLNWFWAKYRPDGSLYRKEMKGMKVALAGRIAKGKTPDQSSGCIYCHRSAGGGDYIFYPEITLPGVGAH